MTATLALIDRLKRQANDMARPFIDAARSPEASETDRAFGEAAAHILRDAETRAQRLPRREFERRVEALTEWHRLRQAAMRAEIAALLERGCASGPDGPLGDALRRATAEFDDREAEFDRWVESHALAAWIRATEDLLMLDRPCASICTKESQAHH